MLPKRDQFCSFLDDSNSDIVVLTETWLTPEINDMEIFPDNNSYNVYRHDRGTKRGGGVLLGIKKKFSSFLIDSKSDLEIVWCACSSSSTKVLIGVCYRPPDFRHSFVDEFRNSIATAVELFPSDYMYIFGDFN